ncbi:hypothetical protein ACJ3XI_10190 [Litorimonas sp. RW-G-Af-16]|uniref:hypothetical protein n=1 Tax=Litorimonas sp. RW-G-Af-16 TaxID=3241168 RepID=UPI00390C52A9
MVDNTQLPDAEPQYAWQNPKPSFEVGRVLGRVVSVLRNNLTGFVGIAMLVIAIPYALLAAWPAFLDMSEGLVGIMDESGDLSFSSIDPVVYIAMGVGFIGFLVGSIILQGALIHACVKDFNGEAGNVGRSIRVGMRYFWPLLGLGILVALGVMGGFLLFIIPGLLLALGWSIAAPILIIEDLPITKALGRSWELAKGYKRWILLVYVIVAVITGIISAVLSIALLAFGNPQEAMITGGTTLFFVMNGVVSGIAQGIATLVNTATIASSYYEIRELKEGVSTDALAAVFD